jgi:hypothetical protein
MGTLLVSMVASYDCSLYRSQHRRNTAPLDFVHSLAKLDAFAGNLPLSLVPRVCFHVITADLWLLNQLYGVSISVGWR